MNREMLRPLTASFISSRASKRGPVHPSSQAITIEHKMRIEQVIVRPYGLLNKCRAHIGTNIVTSFHHRAQIRMK